MDMILSVTDFKTYGFKLSTDNDAHITRAIEDAEMFWLKPAIGDANYMDMASATPTPDHLIVMNGGSIGGRYLAGVKKAIAHWAFCAVLRDNINSTRFGSVQKADANSTKPNEDEIAEVMHYHSTIARRYLRECLEVLGVKELNTPDYFKQF